MCVDNKTCQNCDTCGMRKWQFWIGPEMHDRGCPWGYDRLDRCPDSVNQAKRIRAMIDMGISTSEKARAIVDQMEAIGVDLLAPQVEFNPDA